MSGKRRYAYITTSEAARQVGVHPNTLRWYEEIHFLPTIPRTPAGYRKFTPRHISQGKIIYRALRITWMTGPIRNMALRIIAESRDEHFDQASKIAHQLILHLEREKELAREALNVIRRWMAGETPPAFRGKSLLTIGNAAGQLRISCDQIRNWERNGLLLLPRLPGSGYRVFGGEDLDRLKVIRLCRRAGYSLTAIRRLMQAVDNAAAGQGLNLEEVADTPLPDETSLFPTFPTDTWLTTLTRCTEAVRAILDELETID